MKKQKMRFISAVLAACMMTSVLPVNALALGGVRLKMAELRRKIPQPK